LKRKSQPVLLFLLLAGLFFRQLAAEEGMFPLSEIHKLDLKARGFQITSRELYNPSGIRRPDPDQLPLRFRRRSGRHHP
jgi:hypothetical protein